MRNHNRLETEHPVRKHDVAHLCGEPRDSGLPRIRLSRCAVAVAAALACVPALAQEPAGIEEIRVTGTRIVRTGVDMPTPVTMVQAEELSNMSPGLLIESLTHLPQFHGNSGPDQITGGQTAGGTLLNLRGAGDNRTLVLLDGRRMVPTNRFGSVDVSAFPELLLRRVETVTGGASAGYGTDAVAGVVNFILDTSFTGFKLSSHMGQTGYGDGDNYEVGLAYGAQLGHNLHFIASAEVFHADAIDTFKSLQDRSFYKQWARVTNPDPSGPTEIIRPFVSPTNFTNGGIINQPNSSLHKVEFLPDGSFRPLPFSGVGQLVGGCNCHAEPTQTYGVDGDEQIAPEYDRSSVFLRLNYEIADNVDFYVQGLFASSENSDRRESIALLGPWEGRIFADNAFLPEEIRQTMLDEELESFGLGYFALNNATTPLGDSVQVTDNELTVGTIGFDIQLQREGLLNGWLVESYYQFGKNVQDYITPRGIRVDRLPMAMDAVLDGQGNPVCNIALVWPQYFGDCAPLNPFGGAHNISPQAAAYVVDDGKVARQDTQQHFMEVLLTGSLWEGFGAGPVSAAFGATYRREELTQRTRDPSDEFPALPDGTLLSDIGLLPVGIRGVVPEGHVSGLGIPGLRHVPPGFTGDSNSSSVLFSSQREIAGGYNVKELFSEFNLPLVTGAPLAERFEVDLAARWADYSGSGTIWAWKLGANWQVNDSVRVRATRSRDVRAATLRERFDQTRGGANVQDPEDDNATITTASFSGGNPLVAPEEADTTTIGVVFQPRGVDGLAISADWYDIDLTDAIGQLTAQNVVDGCFQGDASLCQYVHRDASNQIVRVDNLFINLAKQRINGVDVEIDYVTPLRGDQTLGVRLFASRLNENSIQTPGGLKDDRVGQLAGLPGVFGLAKTKITANVRYANGPLGLFVQGRWIDSGILDRFRTEGVSIDNNKVSSTFYTDLAATYTFDGAREWQVFLNVQNLLDREPPIAPGIVGRTGTNEFNSALHDVLGRRYVLGFRLNL